MQRCRYTPVGCAKGLGVYAGIGKWPGKRPQAAYGAEFIILPYLESIYSGVP